MSYSLWYLSTISLYWNLCLDNASCLNNSVWEDIISVNWHPILSSSLHGMWNLSSHFRYNYFIFMHTYTITAKKNISNEPCLDHWNQIWNEHPCDYVYNYCSYFYFLFFSVLKINILVIKLQILNYEFVLNFPFCYMLLIRNWYWLNIEDFGYPYLFVE